MKNIGTTGTRNGMTVEQFNKFTELMIKIADNSVVLHHGDCIGADAEAHDICHHLGMLTYIHPPEKDELRAFKVGTMLAEPKGYFARNRDIVNESGILYAFPAADFETPKGGTWYTINYARKVNKPIVIIWPNGDDETRDVIGALDYFKD